MYAKMRARMIDANVHESIVAAMDALRAELLPLIAQSNFFAGIERGQQIEDPNSNVNENVYRNREGEFVSPAAQDVDGKPETIVYPQRKERIQRTKKRKTK